MWNMVLILVGQSVSPFLYLIKGLQFPIRLKGKFYRSLVRPTMIMAHSLQDKQKTKYGCYGDDKKLKETEYGMDIINVRGSIGVA